MFWHSLQNSAIILQKLTKFCHILPNSAKLCQCLPNSPIPPQLTGAGENSSYVWKHRSSTNLSAAALHPPSIWLKTTPARHGYRWTSDTFATIKSLTRNYKRLSVRPSRICGWQFRFQMVSCPHPCPINYGLEKSMRFPEIWFWICLRLASIRLSIRSGSWTPGILPLSIIAGFSPFVSLPLKSSSDNSTMAPNGRDQGRFLLS